VTDIDEIVKAFRKSVCDEVEITPHGIDRFLVHTPFSFEDGDHYVVLLKQSPSGSVLTDEGHTFMHVSYDLRQFDQGTRGSIIDQVLANYHIENIEGELLLNIPGDGFGDALFTFIQAITRITDISFLTRERVRSTFSEDFIELVRNSAPAREVAIGYSHPTHDPDKRYAVDARVNGTSERQVLLFGIMNDNQCRDATIILNRWERWGEQYTAIAVFQDQTEINRTALARFSDVAGRQFSSLETARDRLPLYLEQIFS
jgi:hypothetical protein